MMVNGHSLIGFWYNLQDNDIQQILVADNLDCLKKLTFCASDHAHSFKEHRIWG